MSISKRANLGPDCNLTESNDAVPCLGGPLRHLQVPGIRRPRGEMGNRCWTLAARGTMMFGGWVHAWFVWMALHARSLDSPCRIPLNRVAMLCAVVAFGCPCALWLLVGPCRWPAPAHDPCANRRHKKGWRKGAESAFKAENSMYGSQKKSQVGAPCILQFSQHAIRCRCRTCGPGEHVSSQQLG